MILNGGESSNRTFMELKYQLLADNAKAYAGSNRTFMELKFQHSSDYFRNFKF